MNIFFDLDGTLLDSRARLFRLFCDLTKQSIFKFDEYWNLKKAKIDHRQILSKYLNYSEDQIFFFEIEWQKYIESDEYLKFDKVFPYTENVLSNLKNRGVILHLITARQNKQALNKQLSQLQISEYFTNIFVTESIKSKAQLILESKVKLSMNDLFVGDTGIDINTAKLINIKSIAVLSGFRNKSILEQYNPDYIENDIKTIFNYL